MKRVKVFRTLARALIFKICCKSKEAVLWSVGAHGRRQLTQNRVFRLSPSAAMCKRLLMADSRYSPYLHFLQAKKVVISVGAERPAISKQQLFFPKINYGNLDAAW